MTSTGKIIATLLVLGLVLVVASLMFSGRPIEEGGEKGLTVQETSSARPENSANPRGLSPGNRTGDPRSEPSLEPVQRSATSGLDTLSLRGRVVNEQGVPVSGATVTADQGVVDLFVSIQGEQKKFRVTTKTDKSGLYVFEGLPPHENYVLAALHPEYAAARHSYIPVHMDQVTEVPDLVLDSGYTISGMVYDKERNPVAGATVSASPTFLNPFLRASKEEEERSVQTDGGGMYRIGRLPMGQISLTAKAKGHGSKTIPNLMLTPEKRTIEQEIVLEIAKSIQGRVVEASGTPVSNAKIEATSYSSQNPGRGSAVSDRTGAFLISDVAPGTYVLVVNAENFTTKRENRVTPEEPVTITLVPQGTVLGKVVSKKTGRPVESFTLEARRMLPNGKDFVRAPAPAKTFRSSDGSYRFGGLDAETSYVLLAMAPGFCPTTSTMFSVAGPDPIAGIDIALSAGGSIRGIVLDAKTQKPVRGATVATRDNAYVENPLTQLFGASQEDSMQRTTSTGPEGEFTIANVAPGTVQIEVSAHGYTTRFVKDLVVGEDQTNDMGSVLLVTGGSISGTAFDSSGRPLAGAEASIRALSPGSMLSRSSLTDQSGRFSVRNLPPGDYSVAVSSGTLHSGNIFEKIKQFNENKKTVTVREGEAIEGLHFVVTP